MGGILTLAHHPILKVVNQGGPILFFKEGVEPAVHDEIAVKAYKDCSQNQYQKPVRLPKSRGKGCTQKKGRSQTEYRQKNDQYYIKEHEDRFKFQAIILLADILKL
jgi:hypothetical protein